MSHISIHAPLRGRLVPIPEEAPENGISIHAPLRGRLRCNKKGEIRKTFQSTPPCGGDHRNSFETIRGPDFNPRPLAGATYRFLYIKSSDFIFQSTPPCGGDPDTLRRSELTLANFNPRPLAGATGLSPFSIAISVNFNPRPLAGATPKWLPQGRDQCHFNPRPLAGATNVHQ